MEFFLSVASFEVVPIWLNHTLPAVLPYPKAILERRFWNCLQLARRITLNRLDVVEPLSFERHFQFWVHPKVAGSYVGTVRRLAKLYNLVFRQKLLHKVRRMRWRVIVVKKAVSAWPETRWFSSHGITQFFQNFNVIFFVDRLTSWSKFVVHNTLTIEKNIIIAGRILFGHTSLVKVSDWNLFRANQIHSDSFRNLFPRQTGTDSNQSEKNFQSRLM